MRTDTLWNKEALSRWSMDTWEMRLPKWSRKRSPALLIGPCGFSWRLVSKYMSRLHIFCSLSFGSHLRCPTRRPRRDWQIYHCATVAINGLLQLTIIRWTRHTWRFLSQPLKAYRKKNEKKKCRCKMHFVASTIFIVLSMNISGFFCYEIWSQRRTILKTSLRYALKRPYATATAT